MYDHKHTHSVNKCIKYMYMFFLFINSKLFFFVIHAGLKMARTEEESTCTGLADKGCV